MTSALAAPLFREVGPEFFRVLAGPTGPAYVDALDALERECAQRTLGVEREEALAVLEQALGPYAGLTFDDPAVSSSTVSATSAAPTLRDRARSVLDRLITTGWVKQEEKSDWRRLIFFRSAGTLMLAALRQIATPEAAVFSDKLVTVCEALGSQTAIEQDPWPQVETCFQNLRTGLAELRGMEDAIERHTREQLTAATLRGNLSLVFDDFSQRIGRACYAELVRARLPARLAEARRAVDELSIQRTDLLERMQAEVQRRNPGLAPGAAMATVRLRLDAVAELLGQVVPQAEAIDRRTAEFLRRSLARSRYLQEVTSENRGRVQLFFEGLNRLFAGQRPAAVDAVLTVAAEQGHALPPLRLLEATLFGGLDSLYTPRLRRSAAEIEPLDNEASEAEGDHVLGRLNLALRDSLTVSRANRFVAALPSEWGDRIDSAQLPLRHEDDLADWIACLLHGSSAGAAFRIEVPRAQADADAAEYVHKLAYRVERFTLIRK